jgi:alkylated DNA repair dioxygenase AlkB
MLDLFGAPLVPGLAYREDFIDEAEHDSLVERLQAMDLAPFRFHGWTGNRRTQSFGWRYDFEDSSFTPTERLPDWLEPLRDKAANFAGVEPVNIRHALIARYDPGAGIGWHKDRDVFERVVGVSLANRDTLRFRKRTGDGFQRVNLDVEPRSAYFLSGPARWEWEHRIVPADRLRFSITFRTLSDKGRRIAEAQRLS